MEKDLLQETGKSLKKQRNYVPVVINKMLQGRLPIKKTNKSMYLSCKTYLVGQMISKVQG